MNELLHTPLSERELEILRLVAQGKSNKEIAAELFISVNTVKVHLAKIFQRIGVASRTEATLYAIKHEHVENPNHTLVSPQEPQGEARVELVVPDTVTVERAVVKLSPGEIVRKFWWAFGLVLLVLVGFSVAWDRGWIFPQPTPDPILAAMNEDRWKELAPMSMARANMAVTVYDNKIYVIGGETEEGVTGLSEVYDIATNTWARLPDKPTPVTNAKAVAVGGKIYVPGGRTKSSSVDVLEYYDIQSGKWSKSLDLPYQVSNYAILKVKSQIVLFGGRNNEKCLKDVISFSPEEVKWTTLSKLNDPRCDGTVFQSQSQISILGGKNDIDKFLSSETIEEINLFADKSWTKSPHQKLLSGKYTAVGFGEIPLLFNDTTIWIMDTNQNTWSLYTRLKSLPAKNPELVSSGNDLYFVGGDSNQYSEKLSKYQAVYTLLIPIIQQ